MSNWQLRIEQIMVVDRNRNTTTDELRIATIIPFQSGTVKQIEYNAMICVVLGLKSNAWQSILPRFYFPSISRYFSDFCFFFLIRVWAFKYAFSLY